MTSQYGLDAHSIRQSAQGMVRIYGVAAESEAMKRVTKFEKSNDQQGVENWTAIAQAIRLDSNAAPSNRR